MARGDTEASVTADAQLADVCGKPLLNDESILWHLEKGAAIDIHAAAAICMSQPARHLEALLRHDDGMQQSGEALNKFEGDRLIITYGQLLESATNVAACWSHRGAQAGSTVVLCIQNGAEFCILYWACIIARMTVVCLEPTMLSASAGSDLEAALRALKPSVVVVTDQEDAATMNNALTNLRLPRPLGVVLTAMRSSSGWLPFSELFETAFSTEHSGVMLELARNDNPQRTHSILFTSGTSGIPKGCPLRITGQTHFLESWSWLLNRDNASRALQQAHNSRAIAPTQMLQTWSHGGTVILPSRSFDIEDTLVAIKSLKATFVVLSPAMVHACAEKLHSAEMASVDTVQIGGDAVSRSVFHKAASMFPHARVCTHHGMSEGLAAFRWPFFDLPVSKIPFLGETCPIGSVAPGTRVRLWDSDASSVAYRNQPAELHVQSSSVIRHYLGGASPETFYEDTEGRWFITGDMAIMDDQGMVYILGRSKDRIMRAGSVIMPGPVESVIERYTGVQTCVVGISVPACGNAICAVMSELHDHTKAEVLGEVERQLGRRTLLDHVLTLDQLGLAQFPTNQTFKVVRSSVQEAVCRFFGAGISGLS